MELSSIIGAMFGGFALRLYAGVSAVWVASEAVQPLRAVAAAFHQIP